MSGCSRRRARDARRSRSSAACSTRPRAACRSTRWRSSCERRSSTSACSSMRARAAACPSTSIAARGGPIPAGRAFVALLACACEGPVGEAVRRVPVARPGAGDSRRTGQVGAGRAETRRAGRFRATRCLRGRVDDRRGAASGRSRRGRPRARRSRRLRRRGGGRRHAAVALEVGRADRRVGGRRRAARARTGKGGGGGVSTAWPPTSATGSPSCDARSRSRRASRGSSATCGTWRTCAQFALPIIDALADWPDAATWGEWLDRFGDAGRTALRRPERVLQTLADLRPMADVGPVSLEEARDVLHDRLVTLDWEPPARRYGRVFVGTPHQARGRTFRVVFVPGLAERVVPQRPREDPLLLDDGARRDPGRPLARQDDRGGGRAPAAQDRDRRGDRAAVPVVSAHGRGRNARARAVVLRARRDARDHRRVPDHRVLAADAAEEVRREPGVAGAGRSRSRHRRPRARPRRPEAAARLARSGVGEGPRALPARPERGAAPVGHQPLGARPTGLVVERRPDQGRPTASRRALQAHRLGAAAVFAVGAAALCELSVPVSARDDSSARAVGRAASRSCAWIR